MSQNTTRRTAKSGLATLIALPAALLFTFACGASERPAATSNETANNVTGETDTNTTTPPAGVNVASNSPTADAGSTKKAPAVDSHAGHDHPAGEGHATDAATKEKDAIEKAFPGAKRLEGDPRKKGANTEGKYGGDVDPNAKLDIEFGAEKVEFGNVRQGEILKHTFEMASSGSSPLIIRQAKPTCGCTVGDVLVADENGEMQKYVMNSPIPPGRKIQVVGEMNTKSKRNATQVRINVYSNDPVGLTQLGLSANVEAFLTVTPAFLNFGDVSEDDVKDGVIDVRTAKNEPVMLTYEDRKLAKPVGLDVELVPISPNADGKSGHWQLKVKLGPGLTEQQIGYAVTILSDREMPGVEDKDKTDNPNTKSHYFISASVNARVLGKISCSPQYLSMGLVRPGQVVSRSVRLASHEADFELGNVTASVSGHKDQEFQWADSFSTVIRPVAGENSIDIQLRLDGLPENADGSFKGQLNIATGHPDKPTVQVIFSGVCRAGVGGATPVRRPNAGAPTKRPGTKQPK